MSESGMGWGGRVVEVFGVALRLGLTSFGGPVAHFGYFRAEYVIRRKWIDEPDTRDLVALCQFLPGPASSQVGIAIGDLPRGPARRARRMVRVHAAVGDRARHLRIGMRALAIDQGRMAARPEGRCAVAVVAQAVWGMATDLARIASARR